MCSMETWLREDRRPLWRVSTEILLQKETACCKSGDGLSSGDSKYHSFLVGGAAGVGMLSLLADSRVTVKVELATDGIAARRTSLRRGLNKVRHIATRVSRKEFQDERCIHEAHDERKRYTHFTKSGQRVSQRDALIDGPYEGTKERYPMSFGERYRRRRCMTRGDS